MVRYNPKVWFSLIFHAYSRNVMKTLLPALAFLAVYTGICCYVLLEILRFHESDFKTTIAMHSLLGIVLGLFLVFRTNSAYDRWWEGRKIWGSFVNNSRNLAYKINSFLDRDIADNRQWFSRMIICFVFAVKDHLRHGVQISNLDADEPTIIQLKKAQHVPNFILSLLYTRANQLYKEKVISGHP